MYEELIKKLRYCGNAVSCLHCPYWVGCGGSKEDLMHAADAIEELMRRCEQFQYMPPPAWIPMTDRLPGEVGKYLVCGRRRGKQTEIWVCEFMTLGFLKGWANNAANPCVSHWMPLPEPPKDGEE